MGKYKLEKCEHRFNGHCNAQKNMPECNYNLKDDCKKYKPIPKGISAKIDAQLNWEKICRYLIFTYNLDETEIGNYLTEHAMEYVDIKLV